MPLPVLPEVLPELVLPGVPSVPPLPTVPLELPPAPELPVPGVVGVLGVLGMLVLLPELLSPCFRQSAFAAPVSDAQRELLESLAPALELPLAEPLGLEGSDALGLVVADPLAPPDVLPEV